VALRGNGADAPALRQWSNVTAPTSWFEATVVGSN
jgi:hypothetical protein